MKNNYIIICVVSIVLIGSLMFYWYEYRPTKIRKYCNIKAQYTFSRSLNEFVATQANYDNNYKKCLRDNGLEK